MSTSCRLIHLNVICKRLHKVSLKALNGIFAKIGTKASPGVILSLVNSYCLPVLIYGCQALSIKSKMLNLLDNAYRMVFEQIFSTFDNNVILNCQLYCGVLPINYTVDIQTLNFLNGLVKSENSYVQLHFKRTGLKNLKICVKSIT